MVCVSIIKQGGESDKQNEREIEKGKEEMRVVDFLKLSISYEPERVLAAEIYLHTFRRHWYIC